LSQEAGLVQEAARLSRRAQHQDSY
jgi:hypothetical protein